MLATQNGRSKPVFICCKRSEKDKMFSFAAFVLAGLRKRSGQALFYSRPVHAGNSHYFISAAFTAGYANGGTRNLKQINKEFNHSLVGAALNERRGEREFQRVANSSGNGALAPAGMAVHCKRAAVGAF